MKVSISKKLLIGQAFILLLLFIIILTSILAINQLSRTADKMELEYREVNGVQELKVSCLHILLAIKSYQINGANSENEINNFKHYLVETKKKVVKLKEIITINNNNNNIELIRNFEKDLQLAESLSQKLFKIYNNADAVSVAIIKEETGSILHVAVHEVNELLMLSKKKMDKHIDDNRKTNTKGRHFVLLIGIITACCLVVGGFFFLKGIIQPINLLIKATQKVSSGNLPTRSDIETGDEIDALIVSFNNMIGILDKKTVSRDYFNSILNRIEQSVVITDAEKNIIVVNQSTLDLLGYSENEIIGKPIGILLENKIDNIPFAQSTLISDLTKSEHLNNIFNAYFSKEGTKIPVLFASSIIHDESGTDKGIICIADYRVVENNSEETTANDIEKHSELRTKNTNKIPLTKREREILQLIAEEESNQQIADKLFISVRTVETHRKHIMQKLHTKSVISLVKYAVLNGII